MEQWSDKMLEKAIGGLNKIGELYFSVADIFSNDPSTLSHLTTSVEVALFHSHIEERTRVQKEILREYRGVITSGKVEGNGMFIEVTGVDGSALAYVGDVPTEYLEQNLQYHNFLLSEN